MIDQFITEDFEFINYSLLSEAESRIIWKARNEECVRKWMNNTTEISWDEHSKFLNSLKYRTDRIYFAVKQNSQIIGSVNLNPYDAIERIGYSGRYLLPLYIGKGLGLKMSYEFMHYILSQRIVDIIYAKTKVNNERNLRVNSLLGYREIKRDIDFVYFSLTLKDLELHKIMGQNMHVDNGTI